MAKRKGNLFPELVEFSNLYTAWVNARKGTGWNNETRSFCFYLERELLTLQEDLASGRYQPQEFRFFSIRDPKPRLISVAPFRDRVVHHALVQILMPIFEPSFIFDSYATRKEKGTHRAIERAQSFIRRYSWYYKLDILHFFETVNQQVLLQLIEHKIKDPLLLALTEKIICHPQLSLGLPIGNLTSQFFANIYLNGLDHFTKGDLSVKGYLRYMDDFVLFSHDKCFLKQQVERIDDYVSQRLKLSLKRKACWLNRSNQGLSFLGMRIFSSFIRHCTANRRRSLRRINNRIQVYEKGFISEQQMTDSVQCSWAHLHYFD